MLQRFLVILFSLLLISVSYSQDVPQGKFSGMMFGDVFYNAARDGNFKSLSDAVATGNKDLNGIQFRRIYFTYDYAISEVFATRFRLEADQEANTSNGKIGVFVKDAYLHWKNIFSGSDMVIGIQPTPAFEVSESYWGHRYLEKTILDLRSLVSSRDIAISIKGKITESGSLGYWIMIGNNSGNKPESDKYKRYYAHINFAPVKNMAITIYGDLKTKPETVHPNNSSQRLSNHEITSAIFVGYMVKEAFSVGLEGFYKLTQNNLKTGSVVPFKIADQYSFGLSLFGSFHFSEKLSAVGRYDYFEPNMDADFKSDSRNWMLAGLTYQADKNVTITPNVVVETYEKPTDGKAIEPSITGRMTFNFKF